MSETTARTSGRSAWNTTDSSGKKCVQHHGFFLQTKGCIMEGFECFTDFFIETS
jgi:hypothetical protein